MNEDLLEVTGMVIKSIPVGEYDKAVTVLTLETGKISAFARGSRRTGSKLMAVTQPFSFGTFKLRPGRNSYSIAEAQISRYFEEFRSDPELTWTGTYFLEVADYYGQENNDDADMLKLLYVSLQALLKEKPSNELVRTVFEMKAMAVNGEFPGIPADGRLSETAAYAVNYVMQASFEKLYAFDVTDSVRKELRDLSKQYRNMIWEKRFHSLDLLEGIGL